MKSRRDDELEDAIYDQIDSLMANIAKLSRLAGRANQRLSPEKNKKIAEELDMHGWWDQMDWIQCKLDPEFAKEQEARIAEAREHAERERDGEEQVN